MFLNNVLTGEKLTYYKVLSEQIGIFVLTELFKKKVKLFYYANPL